NEGAIAFGACVAHLGSEAETSLSIDQLREIVLDQRARRGEVRRFPHAQAQRVAAVEAARIPRAGLANLVQRARAALELLDQIDVAAVHLKPLLERGRSGIGPARCDLAQPREQPWIAE